MTMVVVTIIIVCAPFKPKSMILNIMIISIIINCYYDIIYNNDIR